MDNIQKNKLSMYLAVLGVMDTFKASWQALTGIADQVKRLGDLVEGIQSNSGIQGTPKTGVADGKNRKQVLMINLTAEVAGDLHSLAVVNNDANLEAATNIEVSHLINTADVLVAARCREIHTLGVANAAALETYGTMADDLAALDTAIKDYEPLATAPRQARVLGKGVTGDIVKDEASADKLLKQELDKSMRKFKRKDPTFAQAYADARIIIDLGGGHAPQTPPTPPVPPK